MREKETNVKPNAGTNGARVLLNLGCGSIRPDGWINADSSLNSLAQRYPGLEFMARRFLKSTVYDKSAPAAYVNVCRSWPFSDASVDVVYASHLFEHLAISSGHHFLRECRRVLKPGGVLRLVLPDLLALAQRYVSQVSSGHPEAARDFLWHLDLHFENMCPADKPFWIKFFYRLQGCPHQHKYMYDSKSLQKLLAEHEFVGILESAYGRSSYVPEIYGVESGKEAHSPSVYVECCKARS